jgi:hypothetical protein
MRVLAVLPIAIAVGAWDPCTPPLPFEPSGAETPAQVQMLTNQLKLAGCVSQYAPDAIRRGSRAKAKAEVRNACVGAAVATRTMTQAQASALSDRLVDQEIDFLTRCGE